MNAPWSLDSDRDAICFLQPRPRAHMSSIPGNSNLLVPPTRYETGSAMTRCGEAVPPDRHYTRLPPNTVAATKYGAKPSLLLRVGRQGTVQASLRKSREISAIRLGLVTHEATGMSLATHLHLVSRFSPYGSPGQRHRAKDRSFDASRAITEARA